LKALEERSELGFLAERLIKKSLCDSCLGRQMAMVSTGMTNNERGKFIREFLKRGENPKRCSVCMGLFNNLDAFALKAIKKMKGIEFSTFVVSSKISNELMSREEALWKSTGVKYCEPMKAELNRELGKIICRKTGKDVDERTPDITIFANTETDDTELKINPIFIYGRYKKLIRGIPQTKWDKYAETVEDIIAKPLMNATKGSGHALHGAGREDIDARCLDWRPFVFEVFEPVKRKQNLSVIEKKINETGKVKVSNLRYSDKKEVVRTKSIRPDKTYMVLAEFERPLEQDELRSLEGLVGVISQNTPIRVLHRRADKLRKRRVKNIKWRMISNKKVEMEIKGEAGLYVKELVTGDKGRTKPSISEVMKNPAKVLRLDVIKIWTKDKEYTKAGSGQTPA
jgi:tRNA pseudouridine synthase 10